MHGPWRWPGPPCSRCPSSRCVWDPCAPCSPWASSSSSSRCVAPSSPRPSRCVRHAVALPVVRHRAACVMPALGLGLWASPLHNAVPRRHQRRQRRRQHLHQRPQRQPHRQPHGQQRRSPLRGRGPKDVTMTATATATTPSLPRQTLPSHAPRHTAPPIALLFFTAPEPIVFATVVNANGNFDLATCSPSAC